VQIDDVWVSGGVEVVGWSSVASAGSDHRIIVADLRVGPPAQAER
jgi:endonuclease/exonuclease/phosphatase (EEP) superfamily protein YafD